MHQNTQTKYLQNLGFLFCIYMKIITQILDIKTLKFVNSLFIKILITIYFM